VIGGLGRQFLETSLIASEARIAGPSFQGHIYNKVQICQP
jgi:hypothetical protein